MARVAQYRLPVPRATATVRSRVAAFALGVLAVGAAYYLSAKVGQTLRYTASVAAIWPPAGVGIAVLYLCGLRWWPGVLIGELAVNLELLLDDTSLPLGSLVGQQAGNLAEIIVGAILLRRLIGPRATLDRADEVGGMLIAVAVATAISATAGAASMLAGGVVERDELATFWRTWWLGDISGALVVLPLALAWSARPAAAWARIRTAQGALLVLSVTALSVVAVSTEQPVTYIVFPALIWAAYRFGPAGATLAVALVAGITIGITASEVGPFARQTIDHATLSTQIFIAVTALTTLFLAATVSERARSARELAAAQRRADARTAEERQRIARELHDSVAQALFSTVLHARTGQKALLQRGEPPSAALAQSLAAITEHTRSAQTDIRDLIFELGRDPVEDGLVAALERHAARLGVREGLEVEVRAPRDGLALTRQAESELFGIGREALANVVKHAEASRAWVTVEAVPGAVRLEIRDDGRGFQAGAGAAGHFGLESMGGRAHAIGARFAITSAPHRGTLVSVEAPVATAGKHGGD
jgi:signal transduction histidine kinase